MAKATFYRHYRSKNVVVLAFLSQRDELWTVNQIVAGARSRGTTPTQQLLAILDVFGDWFLREDFEACSFINVILEMGPSHPLGRSGIDYLARIRTTSKPWPKKLASPGRKNSHVPGTSS